MNRPIRRVATAALALFGLLFLNVNYIQVVRADALRKDSRNNRLLLDEYSRPRGDVIAGQSTIATSRETNDRLKYLRVYGGGRADVARVFAPITGYYSLVYGATGVERAYNDALSGADDRLFVRRLSDLLTGRESQGASVKLTIEPNLQLLAARELGNRKGAVVALDPKTGKVLAMVTSPSYDPNALSSHRPEQIRAARDRLNDDPNRPMQNRAAEEVYPPGSTFKVITAAAAIEFADMNPDTQVPCSAEMTLPDTRNVKLRNFGGESCAPKVTLREALQHSYNTTFAQLGIDLKADRMTEMAERFGFNASPGYPLRSVDSVFPSGANRPQLAQSAIGQFDVRSTPLQMAMVAAAIANRGSMMKPYLVDQVLRPDLSVLDQTKPSELRQPINDRTAAALTDMMLAVVQGGTGRRAAIPGVQVAGKTGTAQNAGPSHAWFIGFAPANDPQVAVAVIVENGGGGGDNATGGRVAAPIARAVMEAVLRR